MRTSSTTLWFCGMLCLCGTVWADSQPAVEYTADGTRDPFVSLLPTVEARPMARSDRVVPSGSPPMVSAPSVNLEGVVWGGPRPQAVIDGEVYDLGDVVQGARITAIDRQGVTGELQGQAIRWTLKPSRKEEGP